MLRLRLRRPRSHPRTRHARVCTSCCLEAPGGSATSNLVEMLPGVFAHPSVVLELPVEIGPGTRFWHFCHVMSGVQVGARSSFGQNCFLASGVRVGSGVKVQNNVSLYAGVELEGDVFCGPSVVFTNVRSPRAHVSRRHDYARTLVRRGATVGANATLVAPVTLGEYCFVGAGAVVTEDVPDFALVVGVPARPVGWVSRYGEQLRFDAQGRARCRATGERYEIVEHGVRRIVSGDD
jgi:UDP-2-acetamido-3-amino-2,3-dideoxy-glucuronate N-acetyltransferase